MHAGMKYIPGRGTEDPGELEDLQRILSLADNGDEEFI